MGVRGVELGVVEELSKKGGKREKKKRKEFLRNSNNNRNKNKGIEENGSLWHLQLQQALNTAHSSLVNINPLANGPFSSVPIT